MGARMQKKSLSTFVRCNKKEQILQLTSPPPQNLRTLDRLFLNLGPLSTLLLLPSRLLERRDRDLRWVEHDPPII